MYMMSRILQIAALVVFLWGNTAHHAEHLMGVGGPYLVWGSFVVMIAATFFAERIRRHRKGETDGTEMETGAHVSSAKWRPWLMAAVILAAAAALTALQYWMKP